MIDIRQVSHDFDGRQVLRDISLTISERRLAIIGANGSGKSTLGRTINGLIIPRQGEVLVDGLTTRKDAPKIRSKVGYVFQNPEHQIIMPTVEEDLAFGLHNMNLAKSEIKRRVDLMLAAHGLIERRSSAAHLLSGGEQKLLTLLSVLIMEPDYIVLDEPMNSLDLASRRRVSRLMDDLPQNIITITHDYELIGDYDRAIFIDQGRIEADGAPSDVVDAYIRMVDKMGETPAQSSR